MRFSVERMKREGPLHHAVEFVVGWLKVKHTHMSADGMLSSSGTSSKYWTDHEAKKMSPLSTKMTIRGTSQSGLDSFLSTSRSLELHVLIRAIQGENFWS